LHRHAHLARSGRFRLRQAQTQYTIAKRGGRAIWFDFGGQLHTAEKLSPTLEALKLPTALVVLLLRFATDNEPVTCGLDREIIRTETG
jgi:hypothetical protein